MIVYLLTNEQKDSLIGQTYHSDSLFNPIQDADNNWIISQEEVEQCDNENFQWVKDLKAIEFKKQESNFII